MMIVYIDKNGNYGFEGFETGTSWSCDTVWNAVDPPLPLPVFKKDCHGKGHALLLALPKSIEQARNMAARYDEDEDKIDLAFKAIGNWLALSMIWEITHAGVFNIAVEENLLNMAIKDGNCSFMNAMNELKYGRKTETVISYETDQALLRSYEMQKAKLSWIMADGFMANAMPAAAAVLKLHGVDSLKLIYEKGIGDVVSIGGQKVYDAIDKAKTPGVNFFQDLL